MDYGKFHCDFFDKVMENYEKEKELLDELITRFSNIKNYNCKMDEYMAVRIGNDEKYYKIIEELRKTDMLFSFLKEYNMQLGIVVDKNVNAFNYKLDCYYIAMTVEDYYKLVEKNAKTKGRKPE